jgi:SAM-dependent methyltransferase
MHDTVTERPPPDYYDRHDSDNVCFLCGQPRYVLRHEIRHFGFPIQFKQCACGLIKQTPMPNRRFFEWFFNSRLFFSATETRQEHIWGFYDYFKDESCRLATSRWRYWRLRRFFKADRPLDIMKIGPSTGTFLHVANRHGHAAIGCDVSERFVAFARQQYNVRIDHGRFEQLPYAPMSFDRILLFNVIENVPNIEEFLHAVHDRLRPGGYFILNHVEMRNNLIERIQGGGYFLYRPPICYLFRGDVLDRALRRFGLNPVFSCRDIRFMHIEKILTLLSMKAPLRLFRALRLHQIQFPIYAYPSRITIAQRV